MDGVWALRSVTDSQGTRCRTILTRASSNEVKEILETNTGLFRLVSFLTDVNGNGQFKTDNYNYFSSYSIRKGNVFENWPLNPYRTNVENRVSS